MMSLSFKNVITVKKNSMQGIKTVIKANIKYTNSLVQCVYACYIFIVYTNFILLQMLMNIYNDFSF